MDTWGLDQDGAAFGSESGSDSDYGRSDDSLDMPGAECLFAPSALTATSAGTSAPARAGRMPDRRPRLSSTQWIWVGGVLLLISSLSLSAEALLWDYFYTAYRLGIYSLRSALAYSIGPLTVGIVALYTSYLAAVFSDPGHIDARGWTPPVTAFPEVVAALASLPSEPQASGPGTSASADAGDEADASDTGGSSTVTDEPGVLVSVQGRQLYRLLRAGGARWCTRCRWFQPPRAHHCRVCGVCIARMDHHCPWVGNCVGARNYGDFLRFLLSVDGCLTFNLYLLARVALDSWRIRRGPPSSFIMGALLTNMVFSSLVLLMVGSFSLYCFFLAMVNQTSIESSETSRATTLARRGRITSAEAQYPFSMGPVNNLLVTLGPRLWLWLLPTLTTRPVTMPTPPPPPTHIPYALRAVLPRTQEQATLAYAADQSGWSYPTAFDPLAQYCWPPRDPLRVMERQCRRDNLAREAHLGLGVRTRRPNRLQQGQFSSDESESESDTGSDVDEDVPLAHLRKGGLSLRRRKPAASVIPGPAPSRVQGLGTWHVEGSSTTSSPVPLFGGVTGRPDLGHARTRRGSEGYEVRPVHYSDQLAPWAHSDPLAGEVSTEARGQPLLPSQVFERRIAAPQA